MADVDKVMGVLDIHRWKSHNSNELECECGAIITGETGGEYYHSPLDEAFRRHIAEAVVEQISQLTPEMIREIMEQAWGEGYDARGKQEFYPAPPATNPYSRE